jgi:hypothetical protein
LYHRDTRERVQIRPSPEYTLHLVQLHRPSPEYTLHLVLAAHDPPPAAGVHGLADLLNPDLDPGPDQPRVQGRGVGGEWGLPHMTWGSFNTCFRVGHRAQGLILGFKNPAMWAL